MNKKLNYDEINLLEIIKIIFKNKIKLFLIILITLAIGITYSHNEKNTLKVTSDIESISIFEANQYEKYNSFNQYLQNRSLTSYMDRDSTKSNKKNRIFENFLIIDRSLLFDLYISKLQDAETFKETIKEFNLIKKEDYENIEIYEKAINRLAASFKIIPPSGKKELGLHGWKLTFSIPSDINLENLINFINLNTNNKIRLELIEILNKKILIEKEITQYHIDDINLKIKNYVNLYDGEIYNKIEFLKEQARIAKKLGLAVNTYLANTNLALVEKENNIIELNSMIFDEQLYRSLNNSNYYLKGYDVIEEEIDIIKNRINKKAFIQELNLLESLKLDLISDKNINRFEKIIQELPIKNKDNFTAANLNFFSAEIISSKKPISIVIILSIIIGIVIGGTFILISNVLKKKNN
jgi:LPS O-antigen subunit length determinant protein (WzzB/FepE family)